MKYMHVGNCVLIVACILLTACRGDEDGIPKPVFPVTADGGQFIAFLNPEPAVPRSVLMQEEDDPNIIDNYNFFAEAYYNTIDPGPEKSRDTIEKWKTANGFADDNANREPYCDEQAICWAHVKFRDTKDLGYGRNMRMRWDTVSGDVAVFVRNFQVDIIPGVPYGPLNYEALVVDDRQWNFGFNAIEFSSYPATDLTARKFAKFYNFAGDGKRAENASGVQQHEVDLDKRGLKPMPTPCIVCHGGQGRTLIYQDSDGLKKLAPTITGGTPGDLKANMQTIELNTLQFSNKPGFREQDHEHGIRMINRAILSTFEYNQEFPFPNTFNGDWDPTYAIEILKSRYNDNFGTTENSYADGDLYNATAVPLNWQSNDVQQDLYEKITGPNCMVCHALRGSKLNSSISFHSFEEFAGYSERIDHLVFERGLMPLGLLNYSNLWETPGKDPAQLAAALGLSERINENGVGVEPGTTVAKIAAPLVATALDSSNEQQFPIPLSGADSAFSDTFTWSVAPDAGTVITPELPDPITGLPRGAAKLTVSTADTYTVTLTTQNRKNSQQSVISQDIDVRDLADSLSDPPAPVTQIQFFPTNVALLESENRLDDSSSIYTLFQNQWGGKRCLDCHINGSIYPGIPLYYAPCQSEKFNGFEFLYRSVLARSNFISPLNSLILRKPTNGATDISDRESSDIPNYHEGGLVFNDLRDEPVSRLISWILNGAPSGPIPDASLIPATAPECTP